MTRRALPPLQRKVALLTEGVDRNHARLWYPVEGSKSPSSRRAWIEIGHLVARKPAWRVALLTEGVDRNFRRLL